MNPDGHTCPPDRLEDHNRNTPAVRTSMRCTTSRTASVHSTSAVEWTEPTGRAFARVAHHTDRRRAGIQKRIAPPWRQRSRTWCRKWWTRRARRCKSCSLRTATTQTPLLMLSLPTMSQVVEISKTCPECRRCTRGWLEKEMSAMYDRYWPNLAVMDQSTTSS